MASQNAELPLDAHGNPTPGDLIIGVDRYEESPLTGFHTDRVEREGASWFERGVERWRQRKGGERVRAHNYDPGTLPEDTPDPNSLPNPDDLPDAPHIDRYMAPGETHDDHLWRVTVSYALGAGQVDPTSLAKFLRNRFPQDPPKGQDIEKLVTELQKRGIMEPLGGYRGFQVVKTHSECDEIVRTVAHYLSRQRTEQTRAAVTAARTSRTPGDIAAADKLSKGYWADIIAARKSLNIPIPEMDKIINRLEKLGFLRVPALDHGPDFSNPQFLKDQKKWAPMIPEHERLGTIVLLTGDVEDQEMTLRDIYGRTQEASYNSRRVITPRMREEADRQAAEQAAAVAARQTATDKAAADRATAKEKRDADKLAADRHQALLDAIGAQGTASTAAAEAVIGAAAAAERHRQQHHEDLVSEFRDFATTLGGTAVGAAKAAENAAYGSFAAANMAAEAAQGASSAAQSAAEAARAASRTASATAAGPATAASTPGTPEDIIDADVIDDDAAYDALMRQPSALRTVVARQGHNRSMSADAVAPILEESGMSHDDAQKAAGRLLSELGHSGVVRPVGGGRYEMANGKNASDILKQYGLAATEM